MCKVLDKISARRRHLGKQWRLSAVPDCILVDAAEWLRTSPVEAFIADVFLLSSWLSSPPKHRYTYNY